MYKMPDLRQAWSANGEIASGFSNHRNDVSIRLCAAQILKEETKEYLSLPGEKERGELIILW